MKNKTIIIIGISALISFGIVAKATSPKNVILQCETTDTPPGTKIILQGDLLFGINPDAIEASVNDDAVYIQFNQSFGYVSIKLYNENNSLIYTDVVNSSAQSQVVIHILGSINGTYTLVLENATGYAEGHFEQE